MCAVAVVGINACQLSDGARIRDGDVLAGSNVGTGVGCEVAGGVGNSCVGEVAGVGGINGCQLSDGGRIRDGDVLASSNVGTGVGGEVAGGVRNSGVGECAVAVVGINACS